MVRRMISSKLKLRKYFGFKNIRGWFGYALLRRQGLSTEAIWKEAERDYMSRVGHFENNVSAVRRIQRRLSRTSFETFGRGKMDESAW